MSNSKNNTTVALNQGQIPELDALQVKDYLLANPEFFQQYPILLEQSKTRHSLVSRTAISANARKGDTTARAN